MHTWHPRWVAALATVVLGLWARDALAEGAVKAKAKTPSAATDDGGDAPEPRKIGIGVDLLYLSPLGSLADITGAQLGATARLGYRVIPALEITLRGGYLLGTAASPSGGAGAAKVSTVPLWLGARYFFLDAPAGPYAGAELALNIMRAEINPNPSGATDPYINHLIREGLNLNLGCVISRDVPIDVRAQLAVLNLLGKNSGEDTLLGAVFSVGYTALF
jgi:hypothetical protein